MMVFVKIRFLSFYETYNKLGLETLNDISFAIRIYSFNIDSFNASKGIEIS